jgi:hypothetical protein
MINSFRNSIETARADHLAGQALIWECVALQHQLTVLGAVERGAAFSASRSATLTVYVVVVAGLARGTDRHSARNGPALAP